MRKILFMALLLVQLAATSFAYTNKTDGFKTPEPSSDSYIEAVGRHFYGFNDENTGAYAEAILPEQADKFLGAAFSTEAFNKKYNDILLLQRSGISTERINKQLAVPFVSPIIAFTDAEELDYSVSAQKFGKNKYIAVSVNLEEGTKPLTLYYTSANDRLYLLLADATFVNEARPQNVPEESIGIIGGADGPTEIYVSDEKPQKNAAKFLKGFKAIPPNAEEAAFAITDKTAGYGITLPEDWVYLQLHDDYNNDRVTVSFAMPQNAWEKIAEAGFGGGVNDLHTAVNVATSQTAANAVAENEDKLLEFFRHGIMLCSVKFADEDELADLYAKPEQNTADIKQGLENLKDYFANKNVEITNYEYDALVKDGQGSLYLRTELSPVNAAFTYKIFAEAKTLANMGWLAIAFDRTEDGATPAFSLWNDKLKLKK